ncbi:MAG: hypothetical protein R6X31_13240 [Anaerolineae bacterium]
MPVQTQLTWCQKLNVPRAIFTQLMTVVDLGISNPDADTWDRVTETIDLLI